MSYCSIIEAWPEINNYQYENFNIDKIVNKHNNDNLINNNNTIENFNNKPLNKKNLNNYNLICDNYMEHIVNCNKCKNDIIKEFNLNRPIINLDFFNQSMRETLVVFIFGIILLLLLNIFCK